VTASSGNEEPVDFAISVDGKELEELVAGEVRSIDVTEEIGRLTRVSIVLRNWDTAENTTDEKVQGTFKVGSALSIRLGYEFDLFNVFDGLIVGAVVRCTPGQVPELEVRARCHGIKLLGTPRFRVWSDQSDFEAITSLCKDAGLKVVGKAGFSHPFLVQHRACDWDFVLTRAAALGLQAYVRSGTKEDKQPTLHFAAAETTKKPTASLQLGENILTAEISQDITIATGDATASAWDPQSKELVTVDTAASAARMPRGDRPKNSALLTHAKLSESRKREAAASTPMDQAELKARTQALVDRGVTDACYGAITCAGDALLRIDSMVKVTGFGKSFDGPHYVTRVRHHLVPGTYTTRLRFGTPPVPTPKSDDRTDRNHVLPTMPSLVIGTVESFEDKDRKQGRVQLRFPWMNADEAPIWARLATPAGGAARGFVFVPEPDDEVLVQFLDGDPRYPVVIGSLWNGVDAPPDTYDPEKNDRRSIVSRKGHKFVFDDGDDSPGIFIETAAGQQVHVDDTSGSEAIMLKDKTGNKLQMNADGISLTAASGKTIELSAPGGTIKLAANEITSKADTDASFAGGTGLTLESQGQAELKGLNVAINGQISIMAKATMIKLN